MKHNPYYLKIFNAFIIKIIFGIIVKTNPEDAAFYRNKKFKSQITEEKHMKTILNNPLLHS